MSQIIDQKIEAAGSEIAKASSWFRREPVSAVIISINDKVTTNKYLSQLGVTTDVLAQSVSYLYDTPNVVVTAPSHARNREAVRTDKLELLFFWLTHES